MLAAERNAAVTIAAGPGRRRESPGRLRLADHPPDGVVQPMRSFTERKSKGRCAAVANMLESLRGSPPSALCAVIVYDCRAMFGLNVKFRSLAEDLVRLAFALRMTAENRQTLRSDRGAIAVL